jgi:hypothetical protein
MSVFKPLRQTHTCMYTCMHSYIGTFRDNLIPTGKRDTFHLRPFWIVSDMFYPLSELINMVNWELSQLLPHPSSQESPAFSAGWNLFLHTPAVLEAGRQAGALGRRQQAPGYRQTHWLWNGAHLQRPCGEWGGNQQFWVIPPPPIHLFHLHQTWSRMFGGPGIKSTLLPLITWFPLPALPVMGDKALHSTISHQAFKCKFLVGFATPVKELPLRC